MILALELCLPKTFNHIIILCFDDAKIHTFNGNSQKNNTFLELNP